MPQPSPYTRQANFKNAQAVDPTASPSGTSLDSEFNAIKSVLDAVLGRLPFIQRDDARLANSSVGVDQLSPSLSMGFTLRGVWATGINYNQADGVSIGTIFYRALSANLSTSLNAPNLDAVTWQPVADLSSLVGVIAHASDSAPDGSAAVPGLGFASQALGFFKKASGSIGASISGIERFVFDASGILLPADPVLPLHAATKAYVDAAIAAAIAPDDIGILKPMPSPVGVIPLNHVLCFGQQLARTLPLFSRWGTTYGAGDGVTTFNCIDGRGRVFAGLDNMGGVAAGRLTSATITAGGGPTALGGNGGAETHVLTIAQLAAHNHTMSDPGHAHSVSDPSHVHSYITRSNEFSSAAGGTPNTMIGPIVLNTGAALTGIGIYAALTGVTAQNTGSGSAHNNVQPTILGNWIVRIQ